MTTRIDEAFAVMNLSDSDAGRLRYYETILESELFLLLNAELNDDVATPRIFNIEEGDFACAFDTELRLAEFAGGEAQFIEVSGRNLSTLLNEGELGLAINFGAPSENVLPSDVISWMSAQKSEAEEVNARPEEIRPPSLPEDVVCVLDRKLAGLVGFANHAYLADALYDTGAQMSLLAFIDVVAGSEEAMANTISEALHFSGFEAVSIDVMFLDASDPIAAVFAKHGLRFDLPRVEPTGGTDSSQPPKLV